MRNDFYIDARNRKAYDFLASQGYTLSFGTRTSYISGAYDPYYDDGGVVASFDVYYCVDFLGTARDFHRLLRDNHLLYR